MIKKIISLSSMLTVLLFSAGSVAAQGNTHTSCQDLGWYNAELAGSPANEWAQNFAAQNPGAVAEGNEQAHSTFCVSK